MSDDMMTADQAADLLGIDKRTLYAYVSRGRLTSLPGPGPSRARRYPRAAVDDLLRIRETPAADRGASTAMRWGAPVLDSALTLIGDGRLFYRGLDAVDLSRTASPERVAALLWGADAEEIMVPAVPAPAAARRRGDPLQAMQLVLAADGAGIPTGVGTPGPLRVRAGAELLGRLFAAAGGTGDGPLASRLARRLRVPAGIVSAALVLCADHELNVSAFTARAIASADAPVEQAVLGALAAMRGRRHGGAGIAAYELLLRAERDGAANAVTASLAARGDVPGFGHPLYPAGDPRGAELLRLVPGTGNDVVARVVRTCRDRLDLAPNLDFGLAAGAHRLGLAAPTGPTLFALGRAIGWIAHVFEAWDDGVLMRPRARYVGPGPRAADPSGT